MILLTDFIAYWNSVQSRITAIKHVEVVTNESELTEVIKQIPINEMILIAVIPSAKNTGEDSDNINEESIILLYLVEKLNKNDLKKADFLAKLSASQLLMQEMKTLMLADKAKDNDCTIMRYIKTQGWNQDPEYNLVGCYGWSLSLHASKFGV